jgi:hypothetical protein
MLMQLFGHPDAGEQGIRHLQALKSFQELYGGHEATPEMEKIFQSVVQPIDTRSPWNKFWGTITKKAGPSPEEMPTEDREVAQNNPWATEAKTGKFVPELPLTRAEKLAQERLDWSEKSAAQREQDAIARQQYKEEEDARRDEARDAESVNRRIEGMRRDQRYQEGFEERRREDKARDDREDARARAQEARDRYRDTRDAARDRLQGQRDQLAIAKEVNTGYNEYVNMLKAEHEAMIKEADMIPQKDRKTAQQLIPPLTIPTRDQWLSSKEGQEFTSSLGVSSGAPTIPSATPRLPGGIPLAPKVVFDNPESQREYNAAPQGERERGTSDLINNPPPPIPSQIPTPPKKAPTFNPLALKPGYTIPRGQVASTPTSESELEGVRPTNLAQSNVAPERDINAIRPPQSPNAGPGVRMGEFQPLSEDEATQRLIKMGYRGTALSKVINMYKSEGLVK